MDKTDKEYIALEQRLDEFTIRAVREALVQYSKQPTTNLCFIVEELPKELEKLKEKELSLYKNHQQ